MDIRRIIPKFVSLKEKRNFRTFVFFPSFQRDSRYPTNSNVDTAMGLNRRLSLRTSYHNPFASPERFVRFFRNSKFFFFFQYGFSSVSSPITTDVDGTTCR